MDLLQFLELHAIWETGYHGVLLAFRYLQMGNICIMLMLYATGSINGVFQSQEIKDFNFWLLIELLVNMAIFFNSILYLMLRSWCRDSVSLSYDEVDKFEDFMSGDLKLLHMNIYNQACIPVIISTILKFVFLDDNHGFSLKTNDDSVTFLTLQWYL